jgi:hypothetical protein
MRLPVRTVVLALAALTFCAPAALAQSGDGGRDGDSVREQLEREIRRKREAMREGKVIRSSVRVSVRLRNNYKIEGVVKNGRFIERVDGLAFVPADLQTPGAGLRIWYYDNTNSFIFLPYSDIASYRIGERLTAAEIGAIEERIRKAQQEADERRRELLAKRKAKAEAGEAAKGEAEEEEEKDPFALTPEQQKLLADYPPEDGWGAERVREIQIREITVGVFPDAKSKYFIDNFEEWLKAKGIVDAKKRAEAEAKAKEAGAAGGGASKAKDGQVSPFDATGGKPSQPAAEPTAEEKPEEAPKPPFPIR